MKNYSNFQYAAETTSSSLVRLHEGMTKAMPPFAIVGVDLRQTKTQADRGIFSLKVFGLTDYKKNTSIHLLTRIASFLEIQTEANKIVGAWLEDAPTNWGIKVTKNTRFLLTNKEGEICGKVELSAEGVRVMKAELKKGSTPEFAARKAFAFAHFSNIVNGLFELKEQGVNFKREDIVRSLRKIEDTECAVPFGKGAERNDKSAYTSLALEA